MHSVVFKKSSISSYVMTSNKKNKYGGRYEWKKLLDLLMAENQLLKQHTQEQDEQMAELMQNWKVMIIYKKFQKEIYQI